MDRSTVLRLLTINRQFYDRFAEDFAATRRPQQPGLQRLLPLLSLQDDDWLLDVGCGNGRLAQLLEAELPARRLHYVGLDASARLLATAQQASKDLQHVRAQFIQADVTAPGWTDRLPAGRSYQAITLLAVLHHLPGRSLRRDLLTTLRLLLTADGVLALSTWQFLNSARLRRKIIPWESIGLDPTALEPGDYLLDWQRGGWGLRYCHLIDEAELRELAHAAGYTVTTTYQADGREGNLNLFAILRPAS